MEDLGVPRQIKFKGTNRHNSSTSRSKKENDARVEHWR